MKMEGSSAITLDSPPLYLLPEYMATLSFKHAGRRVTYAGNGRQAFEAALGAVQAFLDGHIYERKFWSDGLHYDNKPAIVFGPMPKEIREIIEQAIDLKTGNDRNKLTGLMALPL